MKTIDADEFQDLLAEKFGKRIRPANVGMAARCMSTEVLPDKHEDLNKYIFWHRINRKKYNLEEAYEKVEYKANKKPCYGFNLFRRRFTQNWYFVTSKVVPPLFLSLVSPESHLFQVIDPKILLGVVLESLLKVPWISTVTLPSSKYISIVPAYKLRQRGYFKNCLVVQLKKPLEHIYDFINIVRSDDPTETSYITTADLQNEIITINELLYHTYRNLCKIEKKHGGTLISEMSFEMFQKLFYEPDNKQLQDYLLENKLEEL